MPSALRTSDAVPGVALAVLFGVFAIAGSELDQGNALVAWRVAAAVAAVVCLWGAWKRDCEKARIVSGSVSVSWIMVWALYVMWWNPDGVDISFMLFMFVLAIFATWYWSRPPVVVVVPNSVSHSARATGTVRLIPAIVHSEMVRWADLVKSHDEATESEELVESE